MENYINDEINRDLAQRIGFMVMEQSRAKATAQAMAMEIARLKTENETLRTRSEGASA